MKRKLIALAAATSSLVYQNSLRAQAAGNAIYANNGSVAYNTNNNQNGVDLSLNNYSSSFSNLLEANVMINVKSTAYVAIFSITQTGATIEEAETNMRNRIDRFKTQLQQENVSPQQIFTDPVSLVPQYEYEVTEKKFSKTLNEVPSGFEIKKNVHITFKNHEQINQLIAAAAKAEVYDLVKVDYMVDNMDAILDQLRQEAMTILLNKKTTMEKAGLHARFTQVGEKYGSVYPMERYAQYYAYKTGAAPSFSSKKATTVQYNYAEKNKTIYYEEVSDKQFDKVINPVIGEPEVQIFLTLKGQFSLYNPEDEESNKAYAKKLRELELKERELNLEGIKKDIELKGTKPKTVK